MHFHSWKNRILITHFCSWMPDTFSWLKTVPWEQRRSRNGEQKQLMGREQRLCSKACCSLTGVNTTPLTSIYHPPPLSLRLGGSADHDICERFFSHSQLTAHTATLLTEVARLPRFRSKNVAQGGRSKNLFCPEDYCSSCDLWLAWKGSKISKQLAVYPCLLRILRISSEVNSRTA